MQMEIPNGVLEGEDNSSYTRQNKSHPDKEFLWIGYTVVCILLLITVTFLYLRILYIPIQAQLLTASIVVLMGPIGEATRYVLSQKFDHGRRLEPIYIFGVLAWEVPLP